MFFNIFSYLSNIYTILYFCSIIDKLNEGSTVCIILKDVIHNFEIKIFKAILIFESFNLHFMTFGFSIY